MKAPAERRASERRQGERRAADRRQPDRRIAEPADGAWPTAAADTSARQGPSTLTAAQGGLNAGAESSLSASRDAQAQWQQPTGAAVARVVRTYLAARAALGLALIGAQAATFSLGAGVSSWVVSICALYALQSALPWLLPRVWTRIAAVAPAPVKGALWLMTIGADLLAFGLLHLLAEGASFNYAALLVLPVLMSGVLTTRKVALATASGVALLLLLVTWRTVSSLADGAGVLAQSGLAGIGLFVVALMASELAGRMVREERAARGSREIARQQAQLNRLVIEEMADGVLVLDRQLRVRAANPAARQLLAAHGLAPAAPFLLRDLPSSAGLCALVEQAMTEEQWPEAGEDLQLVFSNNQKRSLRMRVRFTRGTSDLDLRPESASNIAGDSLCVVLLEDVRTAQARLRQERLAAMGRVSAGIAHEIRNPLAAIAQANQLLLEESLVSSQRQLSQLVADNVRRLQRIVEDVLELAPGGGGFETRAIDVVAVTRAAVLEWAQTAQVVVGLSDNADEEHARARLRLDVPAGSLFAVFDPEHLRRVLVNLLDNALRHSTHEAHALMLRLALRDEASIVLSVANDGAPIAADVEPYLFEPFFSTRSRGSGLGLYICRELCERYGASIEYRARSPVDRYRNGFIVVMRRSSGPDAVGSVEQPGSPQPEAAQQHRQHNR